jgi:hypothetical protein
VAVSCGHGNKPSGYIIKRWGTSPLDEQPLASQKGIFSMALVNSDYAGGESITPIQTDTITLVYSLFDDVVGLSTADRGYLA